MKNLIVIFTFIFFLNKNIAQTQCDTIKLVRDLYYYQFGGEPVGYLNSNINNYLKCGQLDSVKKTLLSLMKREWKDKILLNYISSYILKQNYVAEAKKYSKDSLGVRLITDSLYQIALAKELIKEKEKIKINNFLIMLCGYLNLRESIPIIKNALDIPKKYESNILLQTLTKLGDKKSEILLCNSIVAEKNINKIRQMDVMLEYVRTNNIIYSYSSFFKNNTSINVFSDDMGYPVSNLILINLYKYVKNEDFLKYVRNEIISKSISYIEMKKIINGIKPETALLEVDMIDKKHIIYLKSWFEKNKLKYIIK